jgi:hypothetical protein
MDVGAAGALSQYTYQSTLKGLTQGGSSQKAAQGAAVLQALSSTLAGTAGTNALLPGTDALSSLAGSGALAPLLSGIYQASTASGDASFAGSAISEAHAAIGQMDGSAATTLLSGGGSFAAAISQGSALALTAYTAQQEGFSGTVTAAATKAASGVDLTSPAGIQTVIQSAQSSLFNSTLSMMA